MDSIKLCIDDVIRLEYAWSSIQNSVDAAVSALRGIFSLIANGSGNPSSGSSGIGSLSSVSCADSSLRSRASSNASAAFAIIKRAFSHSHMLPPPPPPKVLRADSVFDAVASPLSVRQSISAACPTRIPHLPDGVSHTPLALIPPTPGTGEECVNPFSFRGARGNGAGEEGGYFQLRGKAGVERDVMSMWVFLFLVAFLLGVATVLSSFACLRGRWWAD